MQNETEVYNNSFPVQIIVCYLLVRRQIGNQCDVSLHTCFYLDTKCMYEYDQLDDIYSSGCRLYTLFCENHCLSKLTVTEFDDDVDDMTMMYDLPKKSFDTFAMLSALSEHLNESNFSLTTF
jgi:hypothetical protein